MEQKESPDTTIYVVNNGHRIPSIFLRYSLEMVQNERRLYTAKLARGRGQAEKYRGYIAWLNIREKELKALQLLKGETTG